MTEITEGRFGPLIRAFQEGDRITLTTTVSNDGKVSLWARMLTIGLSMAAALSLLQVLGSGIVVDEAMQVVLALMFVAAISAPFLTFYLLKRRDFKIDYVIDLGEKKLSYRHARTKVLEKNVGTIPIDDSTVAVQSDYSFSLQNGYRSAQTAFYMETAPREGSKLKAGDQNAGEVRSHVSALNYFLEMARTSECITSQPEEPAQPSYNPLD